MATPNLDTEIVKLRRKLGDIYDESSNLIVTNTSPGAGEIYVGNAALVATWKRDELLDCYNDAVKSFLEYLIKFVPKSQWGLYIPGYIVFGYFSSTTGTGSIAINGVTYGYVDLDNTNIKGLHVIDMRDAAAVATPDEMKLGVEIPPNEFFVRAWNTRNKSTHLFYTRASLQGVSNPNVIPLLNYTTGAGTPKIELVYLKKHADLTHNHATDDLVGINSTGLKRIQIIAEIFAQRYRSQEMRDLPDIEMQSIMQRDVIQPMRDVNG